MARNLDITSANAKINLACILFPAGLPFEGFSADGAASQDLIQQVEARMGVDGKISFGYTPTEKRISFTFQPNSPTVDRLDYLVQTQDTAQQPIVCQMSISLPALKKTIVLQNGCCTNSKLLPNVARVLDPMQYDFVFESFNVVPMA